MDNVGHHQRSEGWEKVVHVSGIQEPSDRGHAWWSKVLARYNFAESFYWRSYGSESNAD